VLGKQIYKDEDIKQSAEFLNKNQNGLKKPFVYLSIMDIQHSDNGKKGSFFIAVEGKTEAEMTYVWAGEQKIIIDHTEVGEKLKGKSAGKQLLQEAVTFAREKHIKILPLCPFAQSVFEKVDAYKDVLF